MQVQKISDRIRGFDWVAALGHLWEMTSQDAQQRLPILRFFERHGLAATVDTFGVLRPLSVAKNALRREVIQARWRLALVALEACARRNTTRA